MIIKEYINGIIISQLSITTYDFLQNSPEEELMCSGEEQDTSRLNDSQKHKISPLLEVG